MKIAVIGAGKIGSLYGAYVSKVADTLLISRTPEHVKAMNEKGLVVEGLDGHEKRYHPRASMTVKGESPADVVMIFVKATQTEEALSEHGGIIGPESLVLTLQNGYGNAQVLEKFVPRERILVGTTSHGAGMKGPGHVVHTGTGDTVIGSLSGEEEKAQKVAQLLTDAGICTEVSSDVEKLVLRKVIVNAGINALTALVDVPNGMLVEDPELNGAMALLVREAVVACHAHGMHFDEEEEWAHVQTVAYKTAANTSSMRWDVLHRRQTEVDFINGAIVKMAEAKGVEAPYNRLMTKLIHGVETKHRQSKKKGE